MDKYSFSATNSAHSCDGTHAGRSDKKVNLLCRKTTMNMLHGCIGDACCLCEYADEYEVIHTVGLLRSPSLFLLSGMETSDSLGVNYFPLSAGDSPFGSQGRMIEEVSRLLVTGLTANNEAREREEVTARQSVPTRPNDSHDSI